jgi:ACS family tartrate transporter-like MFS transporter
VKQHEASAIAKAGRRLLPFLCLCYAVNFLDRVNVGFAALAMNDDLGFSPSVFGVGAGIFFAGYILFEVPSNLAMQKFGARIWIARIMISWGLVAIAMAFVTGERSFYAIRFLLGVAEAGFFPGIILYLTYWFPARERARIVALFMAAVPLATMVGGPVSGALLELHGLLGLKGWHWLFIVEGLPAVILGVIAFKFLDFDAAALAHHACADPRHGRDLCRDRHILVAADLDPDGDGGGGGARADQLAR